MNSSPNARVLVCIPSFNEARTISDIVSRCKKYADEALIYGDGSTDDTQEVAVWRL